jgi:hypothetical protein
MKISLGSESELTNQCQTPNYGSAMQLKRRCAALLDRWNSLIAAQKGGLWAPFRYAAGSDVRIEDRRGSIY